MKVYVMTEINFGIGNGKPMCCLCGTTVFRSKEAAVNSLSEFDITDFTKKKGQSVVAKEIEKEHHFYQIDTGYGQYCKMIDIIERDVD